MTSVVTQNPGSLALSQMTVEDLRAELGRALKITAAHIAHLAAIWRELERRGEDLSGLRSGLWTYMPAIASGDLLPELVVKYAGYATLLGRLSGLSLADQRRILDDDRVAIVERRGDAWVEETKPITSLRAVQVGQVIRDRIVPPEDQRRAARGLSERKVGATLRDRAIARAQSEARQKISGTLATSIPLAGDERAALEKAAKEAGVPITRLVRAALVNAGLLD